MFNFFRKTSEVVRYTVTFVELASGDVVTFDGMTDRQIANMVINGYEVIERKGM
jgi:hypothetical protein